MRIVVIAPTPFFADRGCHVRILGEVKALQKLGHEIRVCTYHLGIDIPGVETVRTVNVPWYRKLSAGPSVHKLYIDVLLFFVVLRTCRSFRPDMIHAHLHEGMLIGKAASLICGVPMVADLQGSLTEEILDHKFIPRWTWLIGSVRWIEKFINHTPDHLVASTTQTTNLVIENFCVEKTRITMIGDGVDLDIFNPQPPDALLRENLGITAADKVVVFIGVLTPYQGIDLLLHSIQMVHSTYPKVKFLLMGYPEQGYQEMARDMGLEDVAIFPGKIPYAEAPRYLALGTIAVSPKISTTEGNQKLILYMALGLPTVAFDNPVNREILSEVGVYAKLGDADSLAQALIDLLHDQVRANQLASASYQRAVNSFSWAVVGERLAGVYAQLGAGMSTSKQSREYVSSRP